MLVDYEQKETMLLLECVFHCNSSMSIRHDPPLYEYNCDCDCDCGVGCSSKCISACNRWFPAWQIRIEGTTKHRLFDLL